MSSQKTFINGKTIAIGVQPIMGSEGPLWSVSWFEARPRSKTVFSTFQESQNACGFEMFVVNRCLVNGKTIAFDRLRGGAIAIAPRGSSTVSSLSWRFSQKAVWGYKRRVMDLGTCPSNLFFVITCVSRVPNLRKIGQTWYGRYRGRNVCAERQTLTDRHTYTRVILLCNSMNCIGQTITDWQRVLTAPAIYRLGEGGAKWHS